MNIIKQHFNNLAANYDEETSWRLNEALINIFIEAVPEASGRIVELGCGTGIISKALKRKNIIGIDCSEKMCELYEKNNFKAICSDLRDIPMEDNSVELFLIRQVFQYFTLEDLTSVLDEIERIGSQDNCVVVTHHFVSPENNSMKNWLIKLKKHIQPLRKAMYSGSDISNFFTTRNWTNNYTKTSYHKRRIDVIKYFKKSNEIKNYNEFSEWLKRSVDDKKNKICISFQDNILSYEQQWTLQRFVKNE